MKKVKNIFWKIYGAVKLLSIPKEKRYLLAGHDWEKEYKSNKENPYWIIKVTLSKDGKSATGELVRNLRTASSTKAIKKLKSIYYCFVGDSSFRGIGPKSWGTPVGDMSNFRVRVSGGYICTTTLKSFSLDEWKEMAVYFSPTNNVKDEYSIPCKFDVDYIATLL